MAYGPDERASQGIPGVVSQIRGVIQSETQVRQALGNQLQIRFEQLGKLAALRERQLELARSEEGRGILQDEAKQFVDYFSHRAAQLESELKASYRKVPGRIPFSRLLMCDNVLYHTLMNT